MRDRRDFKLKESFREFMANFKVSLVLLLIISVIVSAVVAKAWPRTKFNYPLIICVLSMFALEYIIIKL